MNTQIIGTRTYVNSKGVERPAVVIETINMNPKPYRVMVWGREVSAWRYPGLALVAARRADATLGLEAVKGQAERWALAQIADAVEELAEELAE